MNELKFKFQSCFFLISIFTILFVPIFYQYANSEEYSQNPPVFIHNSEISKTNFLGFGSSQTEFSIFVENVNKTHPTSVELISGTLTKTSESLSSNLSDYVQFQNAKLENIIDPESVKKFNFTLNEEILDESTYSGKIQIKQGTKDPTLVSVTLNYKTDPLFSIILAVAGMGTAGIIGLLFSWKDSKNLYGKSVTSGDSTIEQINRRIEDLNRLRNRMFETSWKSLETTFNAKKNVLETYRDSLSLSKELDEVKWLDFVLQEIEKEYYTKKKGNIIDEEHIEEHLIKLRAIFVSNKTELQEKIIFGDSTANQKLNSTIRKLKFLNGIFYEYEKAFDEFIPNKALPFIKRLPRDAKIQEFSEIIRKIKLYSERPKIVKDWESDLRFIENVRTILNKQKHLVEYSENEREILRKLNGYISRKHHQLTNNINKLKNNFDFTSEERKNLEEVIKDFEDKQTRLRLDTEIIEKLLDEKPKRKANKDILNKKNIFQFLAMGVIAIPGSVFITDNFSGPVFLNGLISFTTGFAVYKIPDVKSVFKKN